MALSCLSISEDIFKFVCTASVIADVVYFKVEIMFKPTEKAQEPIQFTEKNELKIKSECWALTFFTLASEQQKKYMWEHFHLHFVFFFFLMLLPDYSWIKKM